MSSGLTELAVCASVFQAGHEVASAAFAAINPTLYSISGVDANPGREDPARERRSTTVVNSMIQAEAVMERRRCGGRSKAEMKDSLPHGDTYMPRSTSVQLRIRGLPQRARGCRQCECQRWSYSRVAGPSASLLPSPVQNLSRFLKRYRPEVSRVLPYYWKRIKLDLFFYPSTTHRPISKISNSVAWQPTALPPYLCCRRWTTLSAQYSLA